MGKNYQCKLNTEYIQDRPTYKRRAVKLSSATLIRALLDIQRIYPIYLQDVYAFVRVLFHMHSTLLRVSGSYHGYDEHINIALGPYSRTSYDKS